MKKKSKSQCISILYNDRVVYYGSLLEIPICNKKIIEGSLEFYDDPEPCMIHRSAVLSRYYTQINIWLDSVSDEQDTIVLYERMPDSIKNLIDFDVLCLEN